MNSNNVIVSDDGRVILIDYRNTGYGPRTIDFAALECSSRLAASYDEGKSESILATHPVEPDIWRAVWCGQSADSNNASYWARISIALGNQVQRNFKGISESEYAITCLFWALRVFRIKTLEPHARFRLLTWMSQLTAVLSVNEFSRSEIAGAVSASGKQAD